MMKNLFIEYPKCSTCKKAKKWLEENSINFVDRNIVEETPTVQELTEWIEKSGLDLKKWFHTSFHILMTHMIQPQRCYIS